MAQNEPRRLVATDQERMDSFCAAYGKVGSVTKASIAASVNRDTVRRWEQEDRLGFRQQMRDARQTYAEMLESLALDRVQNPEGNRGGDTLLIALNNANNPDKWRGNAMTVELPDHVAQTLAALQVQAQEIQAKQLAKGGDKVVKGEATTLPWE